jgi:hypothetical protein
MGATPVVLGLGPSGPSVGGGKAAVVADYVADGRIDQGHRVDELQAALAERRDDARFADAVGNKLDEMLLGVHTSGEPAEPPAAAEARELSGRSTFERSPDALTGAKSAGSVLDLPRPSPGEDRPPWPFIALSALAVLLAMTGIGSSVYRRARRAPVSGH